MLRYLRLYACFLRFSFSRAMEFRLDFFFRVGMDALWYAVHLAFFTVVYRHTQLLGGWNYDQIVVFAAAMFVVDALQMTIFSNNMYMLPMFVNRGDLDYYLVRPVSSLFFLSLRDFAANSFLNLVMASGIMVWAVARYPEPLGAPALVLFLALILVGVFLHYVLTMLFTLPVFWLQGPHGLRDVYWSMSGLAHRPHRIYQGWLRRVLTTVLPFSLFVSFPADALFSGPSAGLLLHVAAVAVIGFAVLLLVWRAALRAYASASS